MLKCPVCKTECGDKPHCPECGFDQLNTAFINKDDAGMWIQNVVIPYREAYWRRMKSQFTITDDVLEKYLGQETTVVVPYGVTVIGEDAFSGNQLLERIALPSTVREIHKYAFSCCENLVEANLNEGLEVIQNSAFECCDRLSMTLPDSINHLEEGFCLGGAHISVKETNTRFQVIEECLIDQKTHTLLHGWSGNHFISVPHGVKRIGKWAFPFIEDEQRIVCLPDGIESIGFVGSGIQTLYIPSSVAKIDDGALCGISRLHISSDNGHFYCESGCVIEKNTNSVIAVENREQCDVSIPNTVSAIGRYAFDHCGNMKKLVIPASVTHIGYGAFSRCKNLEGLYFEYEAAGTSWDAWWHFGLKAKCYWKGSWHYEPMSNE